MTNNISHCFINLLVLCFTAIINSLPFSMLYHDSGNQNYCLKTPNDRPSLLTWTSWYSYHKFDKLLKWGQCLSLVSWKLPCCANVVISSPQTYQSPYLYFPSSVGCDFLRMSLPRAEDAYTNVGWPTSWSPNPSKERFQSKGRNVKEASKWS